MYFLQIIKISAPYRYMEGAPFCYNLEYEIRFYLAKNKKIAKYKAGHKTIANPKPDKSCLLVRIKK